MQTNMFGTDLNILSITLSALIPIVLGFIWYGPLFGKKWINLISENRQNTVSKNQKQMIVSMTGLIISSFIMSTILEYWIDQSFAFTWIEGASAGGIIWLGFIATTFLTNYLFAQRNIILWLIDALYWLVSLILMGILLTFFS